MMMTKSSSLSNLERSDATLQVDVEKTMRYEMRQHDASQEERARQAAEVERLHERMLAYSFPVQHMLKLHLHLYGPSSAHDTLDILERHVQAMKGMTNAACDDRSLPN